MVTQVCGFYLTECTFTFHAFFLPQALSHSDNISVSESYPPGAINALTHRPTPATPSGLLSGMTMDISVLDTHQSALHVLPHFSTAAMSRGRDQDPPHFARANTEAPRVQVPCPKTVI